MKLWCFVARHDRRARSVALRRLKSFCAVAETGSFTAAAQKVRNVRSSVTVRIQPAIVRAL
ncbi:helix-turn-helix domain-containing protein [Caballeronia glebae]|uniref:helix-turn-helix domain-containing protein n=1 Tax=Caballeronia glebae TaxID=1777143 RepID=UPI001F4072A1|nr:LysR family transcriptional regulator [Caballeronia glebae]